MRVCVRMFMCVCGCVSVCMCDRVRECVCVSACAVRENAIARRACMCAHECECVCVRVCALVLSWFRQGRGIYFFGYVSDEREKVSFFFFFS